MIGIIGAMEVEIKNLEKLIENKNTKTVSSINYVSGFINGKEVVLAECGVGKVNSAVCAQTMILEYEPGLIINTGVAGGLHHLMKVGDIAIATHVVQHDIDTTAAGDPRGMISKLNIIDIPCESKIINKIDLFYDEFSNTNFYKGVIVTGDQFVTDKEKLIDIKSQFKAIACEMEGGSIGQVCLMNGIPFAVIRSISDHVDNNSTVDYTMFLQKAANTSGRLVQRLISVL